MSGKTKSPKTPLGAAVLDRVSLLSSAIRRASFMGAAATALVAGSPMLYSRALAAEVTTVAASQQASAVSASDAAEVQDLLAVPMQAVASNGVVPFYEQIETGADSIDHTNTGTLEEDVVLSGEQGDVSFSNSGDVIGSIHVESGKSDFSQMEVYLQFQDSYQYVGSTIHAWWHKEEGEYKNGPNENVSKTVDIDLRFSDQWDTAVRVNNSGSVNFTGEIGVRADNESGALIEIFNSGDISAVDTQYGSVGILADASTGQSNKYQTVDKVNPQFEYGYFQYSDGSYKYSYGFKQSGRTELIAYGEKTVTSVNQSGFQDTGDINIVSSGTIDVSGAQATSGIIAITAGHAEVSNEGTVYTGHGANSVGLLTKGFGDSSVHNSGTIEVGNRATGVASVYDRVAGEFYRLVPTGDTLIVNSGDIISRIQSAEELLASEDQQYIEDNARTHWSTGEVQNTYIGSVGMYAYTSGTNGLAGFTNAYRARAVDRLADAYLYHGLTEEAEYFQKLREADTTTAGVEFTTTTMINEGSIRLGDAGQGMLGATLYGDFYMVNSGDISVGDAHARKDPYGWISPYVDRGIGMSTNVESVYANLTLHNTETGVVTTGDAGVGMAGTINFGSLTNINDGQIHVGAGQSITWDKYTGSECDAYWNCVSTFEERTSFRMAYGMRSTLGMNTYSAQLDMANNGIITTGDGAFGMSLIRTRQFVAAPDLYAGRFDAQIVNTGSISTGNNATGIELKSQTDGFIYNGGDVTIGSYDQSFVFDDEALVARSKYSYTDHVERLNAGIRMRVGRTGQIVNSGDVITGSGTRGVELTGNRDTVLGYGKYLPEAYLMFAQSADGSVQSGNDSTGLLIQGGGIGVVDNQGSISVGDNAIGVDSRFFGFANYHTSVAPLTYGEGHGLVVNSGDISAGSNSVGVSMTGVYTQQFACSDGSLCDSLDGVAFDLVGSSQLVNYGSIVVGDNSTAVQLTGKMAGDAHLINRGEIAAGEGGLALEINTANLMHKSGTKVVYDVQAWPLVNGGFGYGHYAPVPYSPDDGGIGIGTMALSDYAIETDNYSILPPPAPANIAINSVVINEGVISGSVLFGAGDDEFINEVTGHLAMDGHTIDMGDGANFVLNNGMITGDVTFAGGQNLIVNNASGNIVMDDNVITFGAGNEFYNAGGMITVSGDSNLIGGADLYFGGGTIYALDGATDSLLTIDGSVSGNFTFAADISNTASDQLQINGDLRSGSAVGFVLNPIEQMSGEISLDLITVNGANNASDFSLVGVSGEFADTLLDASVSTDQNGRVIATALFGMGHMTMATTAATSMLQNWWMQSMSSFDKRNSQWLAGNREQGLSLWGAMAHDEGTVSPDHGVQDTSFDQLISGTQFGFTYSTSVAGAQLAVGPNFAKGQGRASLNANTATATSDAIAFGVNASLTHNNGFYLDAAWQKALMQFNFSTPDSALPTTAKTDGEGTGFNIEAGYRFDLESGLSLLPQIQYSAVDADLDDFASSNGIYRQSDVGGKATRLRAGMSLFKSFTTTNGSITPLINLSYLNATQGESQLKTNGVDFGTDTSGAGYSLELGLTGSYRHWDIGVRLGASDTSATDLNLSTNVNVRYHW